MSYLNDAPDRALQPPHDFYDAYTSDAFNEYDSMHVGAVVPYELVKPVQTLLEMRNGMDDDNPLKEPLDQLYRKCVERWRDI